VRIVNANAVCLLCPIVLVDKHTQAHGLSFSVPIPSAECLLTGGCHQNHELGKARHADQCRRNDREQFSLVLNSAVRIRKNNKSHQIYRNLKPKT
jgi:hypothetical protein